MRELAVAVLLYFAVCDGFIFLLTGESLHHAAIYNRDGRLGSKEHLDRQDRAEYENMLRLRAKFTCDSDGTATAAANGDLPVPKDCQARPSPKASQE